MIHVYSFDPGKVTGWCHISVHEDAVGCFNSGETDHIGVGNMLSDNLAIKAASSRPELETIFIAERFMMNTRITPQPYSLETIGLIRYFAAIYQFPLHMQGPSEAKNLIKDEVIKRAGLWVPGAGHAMDATRHALHFLVTKKGLLKECLKKV